MSLSCYCYCCHHPDYFLRFTGRILSTPKARPVLVNGAVRKGERLIPPSAFEILVHATFPSSSARVKVNVQLALLFSNIWIYCSSKSLYFFDNLLLLYRLQKDLRQYIPLWKRWLLVVLLEVKQWNKFRSRYSVLLSEQQETVCRPYVYSSFVFSFLD